MKRASRMLFLGVALSLSAAVTWAADWAPATVDWDKLPEIKRTKAGLYLTPAQAWEMKKANPKGVAFLDIRTRAEAMYVGIPAVMDALVPFVEHQEIMTDWDDKRHMYKLEPLQDFVPEVERRLAELSLGKDATVILICRSGDRSSKAADRLLAAGFMKVYSVPEGFEGDRASGGEKAGQRVVNGWRNANLPWTYKLDKAKMYFPR